MLLESKDEALKVIEEAKNDERERDKEIQDLQTRLTSRESMFDNKLLEFEQKQQKLYEQLEKLESAKEEIKKVKQEQLEKLEKIASLTKDEAQKTLLTNVEVNMKDELLGRIRKLEQEGNQELDNRAKRIISTVIQRIASGHTAET